MAGILVRCLIKSNRLLFFLNIDKIGVGFYMQRALSDGQFRGSSLTSVFSATPRGRPSLFTVLPGRKPGVALARNKGFCAEHSPAQAAAGHSQSRYILF